MNANDKGGGSARARATPFGWLRAWALRASCASWRKRLEGLERLERARGGAPPIVVFWHEKYVVLLPLLRGREACVFTSLSARGDAIADLLGRFGYRAVQLPDFGGDASLARMHEALAEPPQAAAIAVDGPLGPRHRVHRGAIELAARLARPIVPIGVAVRPRRVLAARWDRLELPRLFARVQLLVGEPIAIPAAPLGEGDLARWERRVGAALERLDAEALERLSRPRGKGAVRPPIGERPRAPTRTDQNENSAPRSNVTSASEPPSAPSSGSDR